MGRKKLEIKRIESKSGRQVTFTKRRNGLIKKANELSILCDVDVGLLIYSARGKPFSFSSSNNSLAEIIEHYHSFVEAEATESAAICETEEDESKLGTFLTVKDLMEGVERHLEDPLQLSRTDFINLEDQLQAALLETRARKTQLMVAASAWRATINRAQFMVAAVTSLEEKEKMLIEENKLLAEKIAMDGEKIDEGNAAEFDCLLNQTLQTLLLF